jgi:uncharacterized SAM-binding protein YcdF (DUF218 family)
MRNMNSLRRCLLGVLAVAIVALTVLGMTFAFAASWLLQSDVPKTADAIVVLAGDARRARYAGDLFLQGFSPLVLVSRPDRTARERMLDAMVVTFPRAEDIDSRVLQKLGVPAASIAYFGEASLSTFDEARALRSRFEGARPRLLVVTSPYHVRRARMILSAAMPHAELVVVATPYEPFPQRWWTSQDAARDLLLESAKLGFYLLGGRFSSAAP